MGIGYSGAYAVPRLDLGEAFHEYMIDRGNFVGREIYPILEVPRKEANFPKLKKANLLKTGDTKRSAGAAYNRSTFEAGDDSYRCEEYGHEHPLDDSERELYRNDFDAELAAVEHVWMKVMLDHEKRVKDLVLDGTTTFTVANGRRTDVVTAWSTISAPIIPDVFAAKEKVRSRTGMNPNVLLVNQETLNNIIKNDGVKDAIKYTSQASYAGVFAALAALFGLERILVAGQVENTAAEGQAVTVADIWSNAWAVVARVATSGSIVEPCIGRTMIWTPDAADLITFEEYREEQTRSTVYRGRQHVDEKEIDPDFEQLLDIAG